MIRRPGATFLRITLAALAASAVFVPFAEAPWTLFPVQPFNPQTGADPVYVSGPVSYLFDWWTHRTWRFSLASAEAVVGAILGIGFYLLLPLRAKSPPKTLCAGCGLELRGLTEPRCPGCGEHL